LLGIGAPASTPLHSDSKPAEEPDPGQVYTPEMWDRTQAWLGWHLGKKGAVNGSEALSSRSRPG